MKTNKRIISYPSMIFIIISCLFFFNGYAISQKHGEKTDTKTKKKIYISTIKAAGIFF
ncbi:MAG: hypothetical protein V1874_13735 [Spirochaetota bacterium]